MSDFSYDDAGEGKISVTKKGKKLGKKLGTIFPKGDYLYEFCPEGSIAGLGVLPLKVVTEQIEKAFK
jgi:hypothetical protein